MPVIENKQFFSRNIRILFRQAAGLSLTTHARVLPCTAHDLRRLRLREIVGTAGIAGRSTHSIATDLAEAGSVFPSTKTTGPTATKSRPTGRCQDPASQERTIGELLDFFASTGADAARQGSSAQTRPRL
jgi:hypothetical protein